MEISLIVSGIKNSGNLGALARICDNFSVKDLILVNPNCNVDDKAYERATKGRRYLDNIIIVDDLDLARSHVDALVGLTARKGGKSSIIRSPIMITEFPSEFYELHGSLGIVLGREDFGLSNSEIDICDFIAHIPLPSKNRVLNISHAASIVLWELSRSLKYDEEKIHDLMPNAKKDALINYVNRILPHIWINKEKYQGINRVLKTILGRSVVTEREGDALIGFFRAITKSLEEKHFDEIE